MKRYDLSSIIPELWHIRPTLFQNGVRKICPLALADGLETCCLCR